MSTKERKPDSRVRIQTSELATIQLTHLVSEKDLSILVPGDEHGTAVTGITEWVGSHRQMTLTVGWDWGVLQETIVLLSPNEIRTNVQLMAAEGYPEIPAIAKVRLLHWIESMPWRGPVEELLARNGSEDPQT